MKIVRPTWVNHDDKPIFSVDVHPGGKKFATGGQGNDSGRVVIWNLLPVLSEAAELEKSVPKMFCQMDNHLACVNCVRWSSNGLMLASGGDDKLIMIWKLSSVAGGGGTFGSTINKNTETWRCKSTLRGHSGDVLDLAWSPQDRWLASCSVDNTIIIWDVHALPAIISVLKGHTGLVKGVAWDPVGKYIASQSDDRSVKIWKTSDWTCQSSLTEPFEDCGGTTHILRLSWSPDGQYLVSAHAMNGGGPTAQIIERDGWKCDKDFVGHRKAVTCVRFHNSILKRSAPKTNKLQQYCCLAVGSRDRSLSIWLTVLQRPLVVIHDVFEDSVLDLSWSTDGYTLLACSGDGLVACLQFDANELGTPLTEDDKNCLYQRIYGKNANMDITVQDKDMIIENADLLNVTKEKNKMPSLIQEKDTKENLNSNIVEFTNMEDRNNYKFPNENIPKEPANSINPLTSSPAKPILKQIETRTVDGKRRITPMFVPLTEACDNNQEFSSSSRAIVSVSTENEISKSDQPNAVIPPTDLNHIQDTNRSNFSKLDGRLTKAQNVPVRTSNINNLASAQQAPISQNKIEEMERNKKSLLSAGKVNALQGNNIKSAGEFRVQVINENIKTSYGSLSKIFCISTSFGAERKIIWEQYIGSSIVNFSCSSQYVLVCCKDCTIRFLNIRTGDSIFPILSVPAAGIISNFSLNSKLGGVITENGIVRIWNMEESCIFLSTTCSDILNGVYANMLFITDAGMPFISLVNGSSYSYSKNLDSWLVLNSNDPMFKIGLSNRSYSVKNMRLHPLMTVQTLSNTSSANARNYIELQDANDWRNSTKLSFIENQIKLCEIIKSVEELKYWYSTLGYHLAQFGSEERVRKILDGLIASNNSNQSTLLSEIDRHKVLQNILDYLKVENKWQRLYMEYSEQLKEMREMFGGSSKVNGMEII